MAINFIASKCACGGKLEFHPQKKVWICKYCGTVVEREATFDKVQIDGIEGISDVVRQTLMDIANNKMESAGRNMEDCERKNHKHVGTLIANISYNLSMISCAKSPDEARGYMDKVKVYAQRLQTDFPVIAEDEINMYEAFGEGVADIYANLIVVFDTLNDEGRLEYISGMLRPGEVFSEHANKNLLKVAVKRKKSELVEAIINNTGHIDRKYSLQEILTDYPDDGKKRELVEKLYTDPVAEGLGKKFFEQYFEASSDSIALKTMLVSKLSSTGLGCDAGAVAKAVYPQMSDYGTAKNLFGALYGAKVSDQETEELLVFCLMVNKEYYVLQAFLDALAEKNVFVQLSARAVISFLDSTEFGADERRDTVAKLFGFELDAKSKDAIYNYYLNNNSDAPGIRMALIEELMADGCPISNNTVKAYVLKTATDGERKPQVVRRIFDTGINKVYLGELLSEYLISSGDSGEVKDEISDFLLENGFKVDSDVFTQYITSENDDADTKVRKAKKLMENGTQIKADCLENYILSVGEKNVFSEALFNLLAGTSFSVSANAYAKYLLECKDADKARHSAVLLGSITSDLNSSHVSLTHGGDSIVANVLQAYVLNAQDSYEVVQPVISRMMSEKVKLNSDITVNGAATKFKKYVAAKKDALSPMTRSICEENRMFSFF